jgi:hypothetical protein
MLLVGISSFDVGHIDSAATYQHMLIAIWEMHRGARSCPLESLTKVRFEGAFPVGEGSSYYFCWALL